MGKLWAAMVLMGAQFSDNPKIAQVTEKYGLCSVFTCAGAVVGWHMNESLQTALIFASGLVLGAGGAWVALRARLGGDEALADKFKALAADTLNANNQAFLHLAETRLKQSEMAAAATLDKKSIAIDEVIKPVKETLARMDVQLQALEVKREGAYRELIEMVTQSHETQRQLRGETGQLLQALRAPTTRGTWGQLQLRRILEMTGMAAHARDFTEQKSFAGEDGALRPDFIVSLPGDRCVVFDSKVPLSGYLDSTRHETAEAQQAFLAQHAKQVRDHVRALGAKEYWSRIETTPEFVVLFIPGDHLLAAALDLDADLMDFAVAQRVVLATPTTVVALLWAVAYGWKQEALSENVRKIGDLGGELYGALAIMTKYFNDLGSKLSGSVKSYNEMLGSFDRNVLVKARRLKDYGTGKDGKVLPDTLEPLESQPRSLPPAESVANEDAA